MDRIFTLEEAQVLLPVLEPLLRNAITAKQQIETITKEFQEVAGRIFTTGGCELDIAALSRRKALRDKAAQQVEDIRSEIEALGVQLKDLNIGLLDFPCVVDGETILLCWKIGEDRISHWHGLEEGYAGRKPITEKIARAKRPDKPN